MTRRFVVQEHAVRPGDVHYDLMIEDGEVLVTFQLEAPPGGASPVRHVSVARARTRKQHDPEPQRAVRAAGHVVTTRHTRGSSSG